MIEKRISEIEALFIFEAFKSDVENKYIYNDESCTNSNGHINLSKDSRTLGLFSNKSFHLGDQLNLIRSGVRELQTKLKVKTRLIEKLKYKLKKNEDDLDVSKLTEARTPDVSFIKNNLDRSKSSLSVVRWIPDIVATNCVTCEKSFGIFTRRHHCRRCGDIFCHSCCNKYDYVMPYERKVRVCHGCHKQSQKRSNEL